MGNITMGWWAANQGGLVDLSILGSSYLIFVMLLGPTLSPVGDRFSRINIFGIALVTGLIYYLVWAVGLFGSGYCRELIVIMAFINAMTMSLVGPIRMAIFIDAKGGKYPDRVVTVQRFFDSVGRCLGPIIAGYLCAEWGYESAYFVQVAFYCGAVVTYATSIRGFAKIIAPRLGQGGFRAWGNDVRLGFRLRLSTQGQRIFTAITFLFTAVSSCFISVMLPHVVFVGGVQSGVLGMAVSASFVGGLAVGVVFMSFKSLQDKPLAPFAILVACASMLVLTNTTRKELVVLTAFMIGTCSEIYIQQVGLRMILCYPTQVRARVAAAGQFIVVSSVAAWCLLLVPLHDYLGLLGTLGVMAASTFCAFVLALHPAVESFLQCPKESLEGFWSRPE